MKAEQLNALADAVENMGDITCPLCGETGFDIPGYLYSHRNGRYCEVEAAIGASMPHGNGDVVTTLRALAQEADHG